MLIKNKSCSGYLTSGNKSYAVINRLRRNIINEELSDTYLNMILENAQIKYFLDPLYNIDKLDIDTALKYINLNILNAVVEFPGIAYIHAADEDWSIKESNLTFICPTEFSQTKGISIPNLQSEIEYMDKLGGQFLYEDNPKYIIIPDIYNNPIVKEDVESYNHITKNSGHTITNLYKYLYGISFLFYSKEYDFGTVTYQQLLELNPEKIIMNFLSKIVGATVDPRLLTLYVNTKTKDNTLLIHFELFNFYGENRYTSFIRYYERIKYDIFLQMKKENQLIVYKKIDTNDTNISMCKNDPLYRIYRKYYGYRKNTTNKPVSSYVKRITGTPGKFLSLKEYLKLNNLVPLYYYATPDSLYTYCTMTVLCSSAEPNGLSTQSYFELTIKDITFDYLDHNKNTKKLYIKKLIGSLNSKVISDIPQYLEIRLLPVASIRSLQSSIVRVPIRETVDDYKIIKSDILQAQTIDPSIIIGLININTFGSSGHSELSEVIKSSILLNYYASGEIYMSPNGNYIIENKKSLKNPRGLYTMWFRPRFEVDLPNLIPHIKKLVLSHTELASESIKKYIDKLRQIDSLDKSLIKDFHYTVLDILYDGNTESVLQKLTRNIIIFFINKIPELSDWKKQALIKRIINPFDTNQLVIHIVYQFRIKNVSADLLTYATTILQLNPRSYILSELDTFTRKNKDIQHAFLEHTSFYQNYSKGMYLANIRDLKKNHKEEIDEFLNKFFYELYDKQLTDALASKRDVNKEFNNIMRYPYFIYAHYPNSISYNILHFHLITSRYGSEDVYKTDVLYAYFGPSSNRLFLWNYLKYIDYTAKDIDLIYAKRINKNTNDTIEELGKFVTENKRGILWDKIKDNIGLQVSQAGVIQAQRPEKM